jgi:hypothetical protein
MATDTEKIFRPWVAWLIAGIWAATALSVWIATRIHPSTTANLSLKTRKISFLTNASHILGPINDEQLLISGVSSLQIQFLRPQLVTASAKQKRLGSLEADGGALSSCSFYQLRSGGLEVEDSAMITLEAAVDTPKSRAFSLKAHGTLNANLSSRPGEPGLRPGFECKGMRVNGIYAEQIEGPFSESGGDSIYVATAPDARFDFLLAGRADVRDTQIPVLNELRFSDIDPRTSEEKSVLLKPDPEVSFEETKQKLTLDPADLLVVVPKSRFYLRQVTVDEGVQVSLHGVVRDLRSGAGATGLTTLIPSVFDHMDSARRIYGAIPALAGLVLGILEKIGLLGKK